MDFEYVYVIVLLLLSVTLTDCVPQTSDSGSEINIWAGDTSSVSYKLYVTLE